MDVSIRSYKHSNKTCERGKDNIYNKMIEKDQSYEKA
jgi:hypothetical protein